MNSPGVTCAICGCLITSNKKYQVHKSGSSSFMIGGQAYVGAVQIQDIPDQHGCHKCYQSNLKARKRSAGETDFSPSPRPRKVARHRQRSPTDDDDGEAKLLVSPKALTSFAALVTSSCRTCHGPWLYFEPHITPDVAQFTFTCEQQHPETWSSNDPGASTLEPI